MKELTVEDLAWVSICDSLPWYCMGAAAMPVSTSSFRPRQMPQYHKDAQNVPARPVRSVRLATWCAGEQADDHGGGDDVHQDQDGSLSG